MADSKVSALSTATLTDSDEFYVNDGGTAKKCTLSVLKQSLSPDGFNNRIINGGFGISQRGASFTGGSANADDTYNLDRFYLLSDGNDIVDVTQNTAAAPTNGQYCLALDVETINKKFGIAQIVEWQNCKGLIGGTATLSFKAKVSATTKLDNVKAAIVAWSGTADTVTSDIISAWGVEGTNPTLIANATYENTPANLSVTTDWATYSVSASVDTSSAKNIVVFIWSDVTDTTAGDFLYLADIQIEEGSVATPFENRPVGVELALCQRYFETGNVLVNTDIATYSNAYLFRVTKRVEPAMGFTPNAGTGAVFVGLGDSCFYQSVANNAVTGGVYTANAEL